MLAAYSGRTETVKTLIEAGADVKLRNRVSSGNLCSVLCTYTSATFGPLQYGMTAQLLADRAGYTGTIETLRVAGTLPIEVINFMLKMDVNFNSILMQLKHNVAATDDLGLQSAHPSSTIEVSIIVWIFTRNNHVCAIGLCISL